MSGKPSEVNVARELQRIRAESAQRISDEELRAEVLRLIEHVESLEKRWARRFGTEGMP